MDIEKSPRATGSSSPADSSPNQADGVKIARPPGWKYKSTKIGSLNLSYYASPASQLIIVAFVCFLCPGMFNALNGIGGGGQVNKDTADEANTALYATFAVVGFFAGSITNVVGVQIALAFGGLGYSIYIASFLCYSHTQNAGFNIFAGVLLGLCAGLLWTAQGAIMMSYPSEQNKGRYISWFWIIFNTGAVIGSLIPLGQNIHVQAKKTVTDGTYIGFLVLTFLGALLALCLVNSKDVIRTDGSRVIVMKHPTWKTELLGLLNTLKQDPWILALFPMFWSSNWFYTYQFNDINGAVFNTRTAALNNVLYWLSQIFGALIFGYCLDIQRFSRPTKARAAWVALFILTMVIWGGGYKFQDYTRQEVGAPSFVPMDWTTNGYVGPMFLYMFYGFYDASWQTCVYWFMGALTNNGRKLANFAGFYKGIQSAGAASVFSVDLAQVPYINMFASCWALLAASLVVALPTIVFKVHDHVPIEEDLLFSDETFDEVAPTVEVEAARAGRANSDAKQ